MKLCLILSFVAVVFAQNAEIIVKYPESQLPSGARLTIRGDQLGLNWNQGQYLQKIGKDTWNIILPFSTDNVLFQFKILVNDQQWMIGANAQIQIPSYSFNSTVFPYFYSASGTYNYYRNLYSPQLQNYRGIAFDT
jgi:hypothetical protein